MLGSVLVRASRCAVVLASLAAVLPGITVTPASPVVVRIAFHTNPASAAAQYSCVALADNPHWSTKQRGGTVLFKTRVTCTGPGPAQVRIVGTLASAAEQGGPYKNVASSDETQSVSNIEGRETTFYTPAKGAPKVTGSAWYRGQITAQVVGPVASGTWTATSNDVLVQTS